ncbi:MAG: histidine kinase N-terminal 7TM domain-containing protein [Chloroflexota bacterium]
MPLQFPPYVLPSAIAALISISLAILSYRRRALPGALIFSVLTTGAAIWATANVLENIYVDLATKTIWGQVSYFGIVTVIAAWPVYVFHHTGNGKWLTRRNLLLLCIEPAIVIVSVWTNSLHGLIWPEIGIQYLGPYTAMTASHGLVFWLHAVYGYILLLGSTILLFRSLYRSPEIYRGQVVSLLIAGVAPWIGNGLYLAGISPIDLTPFAFTITGLALAWGLFRFQLLDIVPVARDLVMESINDGVLVLDAQNRIVDLNAAVRRIIGEERSKGLIGQPTNRVFTQVHEQVIQKLGSVDSMEISLGEAPAQRFFDLRVSSLTDRRGKLTGRVVILHEITEHKRIEDQMRAQNEALVKTNLELEIARNKAEEATRLKSQFLATMSHELRTPLNAIIGYSDIVLAGMTGELSSEQRNYQERVLANAEHLLGLINDVLDLSKVEAGRMEIARKPFNIQSWLRDIEFQTKGLAEKKKLSFNVILDAHMPANILGDSSRLKQLAINLLSNAVKFTDAGGLTLEVCKGEDATWTLAVTDTGVGIPPHMLDVVFDEFRQVDGTSRRAHGGTGLGLAIVRKFAVTMGGNVRVTSEVGKGSTFTITLPLLVEPTPEASNGHLISSN